ncbi:hypothetical protein CROQUDRAFT_22410, partial [Cronartium quercuum f. sp. fusiforme G11]
ELANPYVMDHLVFLPELATNSKITCLSQSKKTCHYIDKKWHKDLDPDMHVQMVRVDNSHFFLHDPVELDSNEIEIPQYFYQTETKVLSK